MSIKANEPIKLEGPSNFRSLNYTIDNGERKIKNIFFRSDGVFKLTDNDLERVYDMGIRTNIDLRNEKEVNRLPSKLKGYKDVKYFNIPLSDDIVYTTGETLNGMTLGDFYLNLLENKREEIKSVMDLFIEHSNKGIVFNCASGKDRVGTIAMLLLSLLGADEELIVEDYSASHGNLRDYYLMLIEKHDVRYTIDSEMLSSRRDTMEYVLEEVKNIYGSAKNYLASIGISLNRQEELKNKWTEKLKTC